MQSTIYSVFMKILLCGTQPDRDQYHDNIFMKASSHQWLQRVDMDI